MKTECELCGARVEREAHDQGPDLTCPNCALHANESASPYEATLPWKLIGGMVSVAAILILIVVVSTNRSKMKAAQDYQQLTRFVDMGINTATAGVDAFEFENAKRALDDAATKIGDSSIKPHQLDNQMVRINDMRSKVEGLETDFRYKVDNGWVVFDGKLVPISVIEEQERAKEEEKAREQERVREEERQRERERLEKEEKAKEQERRVAEAERRKRKERERRRELEYWYTGGTLHHKSGLEWQTASSRDKLATCGDFVTGMWQGGSLKPHIANSLSTVEDVRPYAQELVAFLDAALKPDPDPGQNRMLFANQTVAEYAAIGMVIMGWLE